MSDEHNELHHDASGLAVLVLVGGHRLEWCFPEEVQRTLLEKAAKFFEKILEILSYALFCTWCVATVV